MVFTKVEREPGAPIPIEVNFEGQSVQAKGSKNGTYTHTVKLEAESQFALVKTVCRLLHHPISSGANARPADHLYGRRV